MLKNSIYRRLTFLSLTCALYTSVCGMNVVRPFKFFFNPSPHYGARWQLFVQPEHGFKARGYNPSSCRVNVAHIWNPCENALTMLNGFDSECKAGQKRIQIDANSDGTRGTYTICAELDVPFGCTFVARKTLPRNILLGIYLPVFTMHLKNICMQDHTAYATAEDIRTHHYLTDNLAEHVESVGCINMCPWHRTGLGDLAIVADWLQDFVQGRPVLRNVRLNGRVGLTLPTGKKEDLNKILAIPFGYNGCPTILFGGGLNAALGSYCHIGFDVELRSIFGRTLCQRIKTDPAQTELLLLQQAHVYTDYSLEQQYTLYAEVYDLAPHTSFKIAYQFFKRGDSTLSVCGTCFSNAIAQTAEQIQERNWHEILLNATYDLGYLTREYIRTIPTLSLYAEIPYKGKRVVISPVLGATLNVDF